MIRLGETEDIPSIIRMSKDFWQHTIYDEPFCDESVKNMAQMCIEQGLMAVLEISGNIVGFACGIKGGLLANSNVTTGTEIAWWVDEEHRGGKNGISLLIALEGMARHQGIKYWNMLFMQSSMPSVIESIYKKMGYIRTEVSYTKVL